MPKPNYPAEWGLTDLEAAYLTKLRSGAIISIETFTKLHAGPLADPARRVRKTLGALRRKIDPQNVEIATRWGKGWLLERAARQRLSTLLNQS